MWNNDLYFYASLTSCYFSVPILFTFMILCKHLHMVSILSVASSVYGFDMKFCFIAFMIRFTDFLLFLSPYIVYSRDTLLTLTYGMVDILSVASSVYGFDVQFCSFAFMICFTDFMLYWNIIMILCKHLPIRDIPEDHNPLRERRDIRFNRK